jgi:hypothetical protein
MAEFKLRMYVQNTGSIYSTKSITISPSDLIILPAQSRINKCAECKKSFAYMIELKLHMRVQNSSELRNWGNVRVLVV